MDKLIVGCGYLGRRVARLWLAQGHRVFGTTRSERRAAELRQIGVEPVLCDIFDETSLKRLPVAQTILYCVGFDRAASHTARELHVSGLCNFIGHYWVLHGDPADTLIYVSSTSVYAQCQGEEVDESFATEPQEESGQAILEGERFCKGSWIARKWPVLRFAGIYGPGRVMRQQAVAAGETLVGDPSKWLNLIHVDDGAAAILAAETRGQCAGIYNISDGHPVRRRDFYTCMAQLLGAPEPRFSSVPSGELPPPHERSNRRIVNRRMCQELGLALRYPTYEEGLRAILA
jgi:nucleoside-diphosphate-sugar epimerase